MNILFTAEPTTPLYYSPQWLKFASPTVVPCCAKEHSVTGTSSTHSFNHSLGNTDRVRVRATPIHPCVNYCNLITMPEPHHSFFTGRMPFLPPNQQRRSTEGLIRTAKTLCKSWQGQWRIFILFTAEPTTPLYYSPQWLKFASPTVVPCCAKEHSVTGTSSTHSFNHSLGNTDRVKH